MQKGLGRARIHWPLSDGSQLKIDFFTTHLVSYTNNPNRDNNFVRYMQTLETVKYIDKTDADVKIFAGMYIFTRFLVFTVFSFLRVETGELDEFFFSKLIFSSNHSLF